MAWGRSGFEPSGLDRPGRLQHQQGLCEVRLGCQDESGRKDSEGLQVFFLRAQGHGSQEEDEEDGSEDGGEAIRCNFTGEDRERGGRRSHCVTLLIAPFGTSSAKSAAATVLDAPRLPQPTGADAAASASRDGHRMEACVQTQVLSCLRLQKQRILVAGASHHWHDIACKGILVSPKSSIVGDAVGMQHRHRGLGA